MTAFQPSGSNKTIIYIENEKFRLHITGKTENRKFKAINSNLNIEGSLNIETRLKTIVKTINMFGELELNQENKMLPSFFEDGNYQLILEPLTEEIFNIHHSDKELRDCFISVGKNLYGSFSFNGDIGSTKFSVRKGSEELLSFTLEVFPSKIDYLKDYKEILNEVNEEISSVVFDFLGKTFQAANLKDTNIQTGVEFTEILTSIYDKFEKALHQIEKHPKHSVLSREQCILTEKAKRVSRRTSSYLRKKGEHLQSCPGGIIKISSQEYTPLKIIEKQKITTIDIYENQYVKYILKRIIHRIRNIKQNIFSLYGSENQYYVTLNQIESKLLRHLNGFFLNISELNGRKSIPLAFKMTLGYRDVFYCFILIKKGLDISEGLYKITPKKLWTLYEIWCYLKLHKILGKFGFTTLKNGIIEAHDNGVSLSLTRDKTSKITYFDRKGKYLELWYNKTYSHLPTTNQRPDAVLCLRNMEKSDRIYIFDAKYRLNIDDSNVIGPMEEDINVMHRYRDAIVSELNDEFQFKYNTFGAYVMFPYGDETTFMNHKYYKSIEKVNIGAFPMLPGSTSLIEKHLYKIVNESYIESAAKLPTYDQEDYYFKFKNTNVMIVNIRDLTHMNAYMNYHFFHIPVRNLSTVRLGVEYIAFYQSKAAFGDNAGIYYYGKIKEVKKYRREECIEIPTSRNNKKEEYLRFEIEDVLPVGPIKTVEYGIELISYTTLYLLKNAETLHELHFKNLLEIELYKILKKISFENNIRIFRRQDCYVLNDIKIEIQNRKQVRIAGKLVDWDNIEATVIEEFKI